MLSPRSFMLLVLWCLSLSSFAQTDTGSIEVYIGDFIDNLPLEDGEDFVQPNNTQMATWATVVNHILADSIDSARTYANGLNYEVVEYIDTTLNPDKLYYVLQEQTPEMNYWGTHIFNPAACRSKLIITCPHPLADFNTGDEGIYCFTRLNARAYLVSGAHRCNSTTASPCDGTTTVCTGSSAPFKITDLPHDTLSVFQQTVEVLETTLVDPLFIQLHGFSKEPTDPYAIISNGTTDTIAPDYCKLIADELFIVDNVLTFKIPHIDTPWTRLMGSVNVQGRFINGSSDPCDLNPDTTTGRFIHIEQEKTRLRDDATGWDKMYTALSEAYPCDIDTITWTGALDSDWATSGNWDVDLEPDSTHVVIIQGTGEAPTQPTISTAGARCEKLILRSADGAVLTISGSGTLEVEE